MQWPFEWFFNGKNNHLDSYIIINDDISDEDDTSQDKRVNWESLDYLGWDSCYLDSVNDEDIPEEPGIYVVIHELEKPALYVGQSTNLSRRLKNKSHHKISKIVELWENAPMGYHNKENVRFEMRIFWKCIKPPFYNGSVKKTLVWYEGIAIGFLCPLMQGNINDIENQDWAFGMQFYD